MSKVLKMKNIFWRIGVVAILGLNLFTITNAQDVLDFTDVCDLLIIAGDANDPVTSTGEAWVAGGTQNVGGQDYDVYTSGASTLYIDGDIIQTIS